MIFLLLEALTGREVARWPVKELSNAPAILALGLHGVTDPAMSEPVRNCFLWGIGRDATRTRHYGTLTLRLAGEGE